MNIITLFCKMCEKLKNKIEHSNYELDCSMYNGVYRTTREEWKKQQKQKH